MKVLKNRNFAKLYLANLISRFGDSIDTIAYSYMVFMLTGSKMLLATVFIVNVLPNIIFGSFAGTVVDFWSKKKICIIGDGIRATLVGITATMYFTGVLRTEYLFVITFLMSTVETFVAPCKASTIPRLVGKEDYLTVNSSLRSVTSLVSLIGMGIAGGLIGTIGIHGAMAVDAITFLISGVLIALVKFPEEEKKEFNKETYWRSYSEGFRYVYNEKIIFVMMISFAVMNLLLTPIGALDVAYVDEVLNMGPAAISYIGVALSLGSVIGGVLAGKVGKKFGIKTLIFSGLFLVGLFFMCLSLPQWVKSVNPIVIAASSFALIGVSMPFAQAGIMTVTMSIVPDEMRARFSAIAGIGSQCAQPLGAFISGILATIIGIPYLLLIFGGIFMIMSLVPTIAYSKYEKNQNEIEAVGGI